MRSRIRQLLGKELVAAGAYCISPEKANPNLELFLVGCDLSGLRADLKSEGFLEGEEA